jgi:hypothetical protein
MSNQTCPTKINMSDSAQTRRSFIKGSAATSLIAANTGITIGLINTPGFVSAAPGTTSPPPTNLINVGSTTKLASSHLATGTPTPSATKSDAIKKLSEELKKSPELLPATPPAENPRYQKGDAALFIYPDNYIAIIGQNGQEALNQYEGEAPPNAPSNYILFTGSPGNWRATLHTNSTTTITIYLRWLTSVAPPPPAPQ